jgi:hypothetical protein
MKTSALKVFNGSSVRQGSLSFVMDGNRERSLTYDLVVVALLHHKLTSVRTLHIFSLF